MSVGANVFVCDTSIVNGSVTCDLSKEMVLEAVQALAFGAETLTWLWVLVGSLLVGLSGVLPLLVIPIDQSDNLKQGDSANHLKTLLSFAVGGLLGDIFLHSLPEIWAYDVARQGDDGHSMYSGFLILTGLILFVTVEKLFSAIKKINEDQLSQLQVKNGLTKINNNTKGVSNSLDEKTDDANKEKHITGYLNLAANCIDNFTHGLSLGGAFLVSFRSGCFTTFAILMHEIPHEVGDFAILLKSGFSRWDAAKFQFLTAGCGLIGSFLAIFFSGASNSLEVKTSWILPFTVGSFLHIALVTILPDLLKEDDPKESLKQLLFLLLGIFMMAFVTNVFE